MKTTDKDQLKEDIIAIKATLGIFATDDICQSAERVSQFINETMERTASDEQRKFESLIFSGKSIVLDKLLSVSGHRGIMGHEVWADAIQKLIRDHRDEENKLYKKYADKELFPEQENYKGKEQSK